MKKEANHPKIGRLTMCNCTQYNRQREEPKVSPDLVRQPSIMTLSMLKLIVEVERFCGGHDVRERYKSWWRQLLAQRNTHTK